MEQSVRLPGNAQAVAVRDGVVYVAVEGAGVYLYDASGPTAITCIGYLASADEARGVAATGDNLLVADFHSGLLIAPAACSPLSAVPAEEPTLPRLLAVDNFPNPFNPRTTIRFTLAEPTVVDLVVFDLAGRSVRTLLDQQPLKTGLRAVPWDGRDDAGRTVATGAYLARLRAGSRYGVARMVLLR